MAVFLWLLSSKNKPSYQITVSMRLLFSFCFVLGPYSGLLFAVSVSFKCGMTSFQAKQKMKKASGRALNPNSSKRFLNSYEVYGDNSAFIKILLQFNEAI